MILSNIRGYLERFLALGIMNYDQIMDVLKHAEKQKHLLFLIACMDIYAWTSITNYEL